MVVIADMTFISVLNDQTFYIHFAFAIIFKKNLHMNVAKVDFHFIEFSAMIVKNRVNEKNNFQKKSAYKCSKGLFLFHCIFGNNCQKV